MVYTSFMLSLVDIVTGNVPELPSDNINHM